MSDLHSIFQDPIQRQEPKNSFFTVNQLVNSLPMAMVVLKGTNLCIEAVHDKIATYWGHSVKELLHKPLAQVYPGAEASGLTDSLRRVLYTGTSLTLSQPVKATLSPVQFSYRPLRDEEGAIIGIVGLAQEVEAVPLHQHISENKQDFRTMVLQAPIAMCVLTGPDYLVEIANAPMYQLWGKKEEDVLGKPVFEGVPEAKGQGLEQLLHDVLTTGEPFSARERPVLLLRDKELRTAYINFVYNPLRDTTGRVSGVLAIAVDVTEEAVARHQIEAAEERARLAIESADLGTFEINLHTDEIIASPRLEVLFGIRSGATRQEYDAAILPQDRAVQKEAYRVAERTGVLHYEGRVQRADGSVHWVRISGKLYRDSEGNPSKLSGVVQDFTSQKSLADALLAKHEDLELVTEAMPQMVWAKFADGYTYFLNRRWSDYTGMKMEELLGWGWMKALHPEDYNRIQGLWRSAIHRGEPYSTEYRLQKHDGTYQWFLSKGIPVKGPDGKISKWYGATTDIDSQKTESTRLEVLVEQRTEELRRSNQELEQFAHVASHDMKEPIRKARLFSDRLHSEFGHLLPEKGKAYLHRVQHATDRLTSMVEGVLNYSTINSSNQKVEPINLQETIRQIENDLELLIVSRGAVVQYGHLPQFKGVPFLIYQLFYNLLNNSLKFHDPRRPLRILIEGRCCSGAALPRFDSLKTEKQYVEITVKDNGIGFSPENAEHIFQKFTRLHSRDQFEGTGMGLALVKRIADRHQGTAFAKGALGEGACFTILLPQQPENLS